MKLSVVIPVFNEARTIESLLAAVEKAAVDGLEKEIVVVDDFSTDGTRDLLKKYEGKAGYVLLMHERNYGKGRALRTGFAKATGDFVVIQDADLEYDPEEYPLLLRPLVAGKADVVYGSRFMGDRPHRVLFFWHSVGNKFLTLLSNMFTDLNLTDMETCYKAFTREAIHAVLPLLTADRFNFEPEITARCAKKQFRIYEVGVSYYGRTYAQGKKIGWKDGFSAIWSIIKFNLFS